MEPASPKHPGKVIEEYLDARGWARVDLADIIGKPKGMISDFISGNRSITPDTAILLSSAFETDASFWIGLQSAYDLALAKNATGPAISERAKLYSKYPIREMLKRGWLNPASSSLEEEIAKFFARGDLPFAARRTDDRDKEPLQIAWLHRAFNIANQLLVAPYSEVALARSLKELRSLAAAPAEMHRIAPILNSTGVRFVLVEALPSSKIDGVCFWLDDRSPVIGISLRYDRIDHFWFTLFHELFHVKHGHGKSGAMLDINLMERGESISEEERIADLGASSTLIPPDELDDFIARVEPIFTPVRIIGFARRIGVHPGIVVGQLQHRGVLDYNAHRKMLIKVRDFITPTVMYDGWGMIA